MFEYLLKDIDSLLITNPINIRYLTGFVGLAPEEREGYVLVTKDKLYLFTNALYLEKARKLSKTISDPGQARMTQGLEIIEISRENPLSGRLNEILQNLGSPFARTVTLGFEETDVAFSEYQKLKQELKNVTLSPTQNLVEELRKFKRPDEIENIKKAAKLTDECFDFILKKIKPGVTETEIAWEIESYFRKNGAENAFPPIVAFNENSSQPHYQPCNQQLAINNLILLDFGAKVNGYCADMTRVVFLGNPTEEQRKAYKTVRKANEAAIEKLISYQRVILANESVNRRRVRPESEPGTDPGQARMTKSPSINTRISGATLDQAAREILEKAGLPTYPHSLGHNLGLAIHEGPRLSVKRDEELKPGMVFTIEPGVYLEGKFGIRIEDLVLLKEDGVEILSKSPKEIMTVHV